MRTYNKLVRDKIPEIIERSNRNCEMIILDEEQYRLELQKKLNEEVQEYLAEKNIQELADILEVVFALAEIHGSSEEELSKVRNEKKEERGGFSDRIFLISTE